MKLTFDANCLIDLEEREGSFEELREIITYHESKKVSVFFPAILASEKLRSGIYASNFQDFHIRSQSLSTRNIELLKPPFYLNLTFLNWSIFSNDQTEEIEKRIHHILFPNISFSWKDYAIQNNLDPEDPSNLLLKIGNKWLNRKCDTLSLWCHIYYGNDVFVTRDKNFFKSTKLPEIIKLGSNNILHPINVLSRIRNPA